MNNPDATLSHRLGKYIDARLSEATDRIAGGYAQDFADYKERIGYLKALRDVKEEMADIKAAIDQGK